MEFRLEEVISILERTPTVLRTLLQAMPESFIRTNEGEGTWSPFDVIGHLVHGEKTDWIPRAQRILEDGERRPFEPFDRFAHFQASKGKALVDLLDEFSRERARSLATLRGMKLTDIHLERTGQHPLIGRVTLRELMATWAVHDMDHIAQIVRAIAKGYTAAVGPWGNHLGILSDRTARKAE